MSERGRSISETISVVAVGLLLAALYLPPWGLVPGFGLDASWRLGLAWAQDLGLPWGTGIAFTYGPLGWSLDPMAFARDQVLLSLLLHVAGAIVALMLAEHLARVWLALGRWPALIVAGVATGLSLAAAPVAVVVVVFGSLALLVTGRWWTVAVTAVALGILGQQKLSDASLGAVLALACAFGGLGWRGAVGLVLSSAAVWSGIWFLLGHDIANIPIHVANSLDIILGYPGAMGLRSSDFVWQLSAAALVTVLLVLQAFEAGRGLGRRQRIAVVVAAIVACYLMLRAGFTRLDAGHLLVFGSLAIVVGTGLLLATRRHLRCGYGIAAVILTLCLQVAAVPGMSTLMPFDRTASLQALGRVAAVLTSNETRSTLLAGAADSLRSRYELSPGLIAELRDELVAADPWDVSAAWAADAEWRPVPVYQVYQAYTPALDRLNASDLVDHPRTIMQSTPRPAIDGRNPAWETPAYQLQLYCDYEVVTESDPWRLLEPRNESRCGPIEAAGSQEVGADTPIAVPSMPGAVTLATIRPNPSLADRILGILLRPRVMNVSYGSQWRWAHGAVAERVMLNAPVKDPALPGLPVTPLPTISLSVPATVTFETMPIDTTQQDIPTSVSDIRDLAIQPLGQTPVPLVSPDVLLTNDALVVDKGECVTVTPDGPDPYVSMAVPDGQGLLLTGTQAGTVQVFLDVGGYSEGQSVRFELGEEPVVVFMPPDARPEGWHIRIDSPPGQEISICQATVPVHD